jgi:hypothetical protein
MALPSKSVYVTWAEKVQGVFWLAAAGRKYLVSLGEAITGQLLAPTNNVPGHLLA